MASLKTPSAPSLERGLALLEMLAASHHGLTLPELSKGLQLPKSSVHCLLLTFERCEYLHRNVTTNRYHFGAKLFSLANMSLNGIALTGIAEPSMHSLAIRTRLTVHMAILDRNEAVVISKAEPPGSFKLATWVGKRMDVHCTGVGKALIAYLPSDQLEALILDRGLPRHNDNTIANARKLREELVRIRENGYSSEDEEDEVGRRCIGAPVYNQKGEVCAAMSLSGTNTQITDINARQLVEELKRTTLNISRAMGYR
jgi:DNA-binding IclR family transcriptional regulator